MSLTLNTGGAEVGHFGTKFGEEGVEIEQRLTSPPTQYRLWLSGIETVLQVKRPNQQYQSTELTKHTNNTKNTSAQTNKNTTNPLVYTNMW